MTDLGFRRAFSRKCKKAETEALVSKRKRAPAGLVNLGNTCYISAVLQCLFLIIPNSANLNSDEAISLFFKLKKTKNAANYRAFKQQIQKYISIVNGDDQQDAQQFLLEFLDYLSKRTALSQTKQRSLSFQYNRSISMKRNHAIFVAEMKKIEDSIITDLFSGEIVRRFQCKKGHYKFNFQKFQCLSLSFPKIKPSFKTRFLYLQSNFAVSLKSMIDKQFEPEEITGLNCEECNEKVNFLKITRLLTLPKYLILHLTRFKHGEHGNEKIKTEVSFDEEMTFELRTKSIKYWLKGVVNHTGTMNNGHYFAEIRAKNEKWYEVNDESVNEFNIFPENNFSKVAYIFIYEKISEQSKE